MNAIFGIASIVCFCVSVVSLLLFAPRAMPFYCLLALVGSVFGIISLCTAEEPKCFRYIGLLLNGVPVLLFVLLFCYNIGGALLGLWPVMPAQH